MGIRRILSIPLFRSIGKYFLLLFGIDDTYYHSGFKIAFRDVVYFLFQIVKNLLLCRIRVITIPGNSVQQIKGNNFQRIKAMKIGYFNEIKKSANNKKTVLGKSE